MKPEIKGKIVVSLVVSMLAFVIGTGAGIMVDFNSTNTTFQINNTTQNQSLTLPSSTTNTVGNASDNNSALSNSNTEKVYVENSKKSTSSTTSSTNSSKNNSKNNKMEY